MSDSSLSVYLCLCLCVRLCVSMTVSVCVCVYLSLCVHFQDAIRVVLANLDSLQPFATEHFNIFPYKSVWERVSELRFQQGGAVLQAYPFVCTLYVAPHTPTSPAHKPVDCELLTPVRAAWHSLKDTAQPPKRSKVEQPVGGSVEQPGTGGLELYTPDTLIDSDTRFSGNGLEVPEGPEEPPGQSLPLHRSPDHPAERSDVSPVRSAGVLGGAGDTGTQGKAGETPGKPGGHGGMLGNLARKLFPFSLFFGHRDS
ncbi:MAJIN protein, partial [Amia calva]|nr:MAJIN protein [Amia calva]